MHLRDYLKKPGSLPISRLFDAMVETGCGIKSPAQLRQWIALDPTRGTKKKPVYRRYAGPGYAKSLEQVTDGAVDRKSMRPHDWHVIWPEMKQEA